MARGRLTAFSKLVLTLLIVGTIVCGGYFLLNNTEFGKNLKEQSEQEYADDGGSSSEQETKTNTGTSSSTNTSTPTPPKVQNKGGDDDVLKVQILPWGGFAPGLYYNGGTKNNPNSKFYKKYGLKVDFVIMDDFPAARQAWKVDEIQVMTNTADGVLLEYDGIKDSKPEIFMQTDWSRGGDVIIGRRGITSINDLKGKKVAVTPNSPSLTYLAMALNTANMRLSDVRIIEAPDNPTAATIFNSGSVDAAVVWSPSHFESLEVVKGSSILQSTRDAAYALAGIFYAKQDYIAANQEKFQAFYEGWMTAIAEMKSSEENMGAAAQILGETFDLPTDDAFGMMFDAYLTGHGDNVNYLGLNRSYDGVTGSQLHQSTANLLVTQQIVSPDVPNFRTIITSRLASRAKLDGPGFGPERPVAFTPPTPAEITAPAISSKPVAITFATASAELTPNAKTIIDLQFSDIAKVYANNRIRVEGNTDSTGSRENNMSLSKKRAESVASYLRSEYNIDANRFIIVGNGPDEPVAGCETNATADCRSKNRRTEFQLTASSE